MRYGAARGMRIVCTGHGEPANDAPGQIVGRCRGEWSRLSPAAEDDALHEGQKRQSGRSSPRASSRSTLRGRAKPDGDHPRERKRAPCHGGGGVSAPSRKTRGRRRRRCSPYIFGRDRGGWETATRRRCSEHRRPAGGARECYISAGAASNGQKTRSLPRDRTNRPRTMARRGRIGPSPSGAQSRRSADRREGHSYTSQGQVARMVERKSVIQSSFVTITQAASASAVQEMSDSLLHPLGWQRLQNPWQEKTRPNERRCSIRLGPWTCEGDEAFAEPLHYPGRCAESSPKPTFFETPQICRMRNHLSSSLRNNPRLTAEEFASLQE